MFRRGLSALTIVLLFGFGFALPAYAGTGFSDVTDAGLKAKIDDLVTKNIISGFPDGTYRPNAPLTRAQIAKMIALAKQIPLTNAAGTEDFPDVAVSHWASVYIKASTAAGIIKGYSDGSFKPNQEITRAELARMLRRAADVNTLKSTKPTFVDVPASYWAFSEIETVFYYKMMGPYPGSKFKPAQPATRSQLAVAVYKMVNTSFASIPEQPEQPTEDTITAANDGKTIIVIDAGHGGHDPGAIAKSGLREKDVNLAIALKVANQLRNLGKVDEVILTRSTDTFVELSSRAQIANQARADIFISVHHNSYTTDTASGTSVYSYPGSVQGAVLAEMIQDELVKVFGWEGVPNKDDGTHTANFSVLRNTLMPAALCESAYMSNPEEAALLATDEFQQTEATGICNGIVKFLEVADTE